VPRKLRTESSRVVYAGQRDRPTGLSLSPENFQNPSPETQRVIQELQVHQVELEMQNKELLRTQSELETSRERYFELYDLATVSYCTISEKGLILENNLTRISIKIPIFRESFRIDTAAKQNGKVPDWKIPPDITICNRQNKYGNEPNQFNRGVI